MAEKDEKNVEIEKTVTEKPAPVHKIAGESIKTAPAATSIPPKKGFAAIPANRKKWVIIIVAGIIVAYIVVIAVALMIYQHVNNDRGVETGASRTGQQFTGRSRGGLSDRTFTQQQTDSDGLTTTTTNTTYTQTQGVITAVASDSITVAGGGKTQVIKTNTSTTYTDDTKPAVNDTVIVVGTKDGDTITATQVEVYRYDN